MLFSGFLLDRTEAGLALKLATGQEMKIPADEIGSTKPLVVVADFLDACRDAGFVNRAGGCRLVVGIRFGISTVHKKRPFKNHDLDPIILYGALWRISFLAIGSVLSRDAVPSLCCRACHRAWIHPFTGLGIEGPACDRGPDGKSLCDKFWRPHKTNHRSISPQSS